MHVLLQPAHHPNLAGTWSSLGNDGTYSDITLAIVVQSNSSGKFEVTCADGGPDDSCSPGVY